MSKALRLPVILVALMAMGGIISWLRPHTKVEPPARSSVLEVEAFNPAKASSNITINGLSQAEYAAQVQEQSKKLVGFQDPHTWTSADITLVGSKNGKTLLTFRDGSSREVTSALYNQLPGDIQIKVGYSREH